MADRAPIFELHIRPLFRALDRLHMQRVISTLDLWDYDSVSANAKKIAGAVAGDMAHMPTTDSGGLWPLEQQALFQRWIDTGCRRVLVPTARNIKLTGGSPTVLTCEIDIPNAPDSAAWFECIDIDPNNRVYQVVIFAGEQVPPPTDTAPLDIQETVEPAVAQAGVTVIDAAGTHKISL